MRTKQNNDNTQTEQEINAQNRLRSGTEEFYPEDDDDGTVEEQNRQAASNTRNASRSVTEIPGSNAGAVMRIINDSDMEILGLLGTPHRGESSKPVVSMSTVKRGAIGAGIVATAGGSGCFVAKLTGASLSQVKFLAFASKLLISLNAIPGWGQVACAAGFGLIALGIVITAAVKKFRNSTPNNEATVFRSSGARVVETNNDNPLSEHPLIPQPH